VRGSSVCLSYLIINKPEKRPLRIFPFLLSGLSCCKAYFYTLTYINHIIIDVYVKKYDFLGQDFLKV
jgi:hypothetical protein